MFSLVRYVWPGASHAINGEFPEAVNRRILDFVNRIEGKGGKQMTSQNGWHYPYVCGAK